MHKFNVIIRRSNKPNYKGLEKHEIRLLKLAEEMDMLNKSINTTYRLGEIKYGVDFRKDERFLDNFDRIFKWENRKMRIEKSIDRIEEKYSCLLKNILNLQRQKMRGYGGSF